MTSYLLDTHSLLWFMAGDEHLSLRAREVTGQPSAATKGRPGALPPDPRQGLRPWTS